MSWIRGPISARHNGRAQPASEPFRALVDEFVDSWVRWREASEDVGSAYLRWRECTAPQRGLAFASYHAALDREDHAARVHAFCTDRLRAANR